MTQTINDNLEVIGKTETVAKFSRSSSDVSALLQSGSGNEVYLRFKNSETGNNSWMAGMDDDEQFKIAYGADGEIRGAKTKLYVAQSGKVGIGTTRTRNPLAIRAQGISEELISFENPQGTTKWHINQNFAGNPGLNFVESGVADGRLFIKAGGNVSIGTIIHLRTTTKLSDRKSRRPLITFAL